MEKKDWQPPKLQSTEIVRRLPLVPLDKIVDSLDPGAVWVQPDSEYFVTSQVFQCGL